MVEDIALLIAGLSAWTFLEYLIHGWLSHRFHTFASPLHAAHHRDPDAVFAVGAWIPITIVWVLLLVIFGWTSAVVIVTGTVLGFVVYEAIHYRLHFCRPAGRAESYLRRRHLAHHEYYPDKCFGVTSALWDLAFGTEPTGDEIKRCEGLACRPPSNGRSNLNKLVDFVLPSNWARERQISRHPRP